MKKLSKKSQTLLYILCLVLMPFVLMLYQYQRNIEYLAFWQVLMFAGAIAILLVATFFLSKLVFKSAICAFAFAGVLFLGYFVFWSPFLSASGWLRSFVLSSDLSTERLLLIVCLCGFLAVAVLIGIGIYKYKKSEKFAAGLKGFFKKNKWTIIITAAIVAILAAAFVFVFFFRNVPFTSLARIIYAGFCVIFYSLLHLLLKNKFQDLNKTRLVAPIISVMLGVMLIMNSIQIIMFAAAQETDDAFFKDWWNVTQPLEEQPNIYWLHVDGMLGFDAMSRFFGDDQEELTAALESRGFWISREASFDGRAGTMWALPALMSPHFYDRVMSWELDPEYAESISINEDLLNNPSLRLTPNSSLRRIARERNETILAFNAAGFNTSTIFRICQFFFPTVDQFYCLDMYDMPLLTPLHTVEQTHDFINDITIIRNLFDLASDLFFFFPHSRDREPLDARQMFINIFDNMVENEFARGEVEHRIDLFSDLDLSEAALERLNRYNLRANILLDIFERPEPRFVTLVTRIHHSRWVFDEYGNVDTEDARNNPSRYAAHHRFGANVVLKLVDLILEHDPDAVIVWQADHGLHMLMRENIFGISRVMEYFDCTEEEAVALWHSTASAIRLPNAEGGSILTPETKQILSDPRNISRFLINNFVGQNYEYIPYEFKQVFRGPDRSR